LEFITDQTSFTKAKGTVTAK